VFPAAIESLKKCLTSDDVTAWKKLLCKNVYFKKVRGEPDLEFEPQDYEEESKEAMKMSQKIFIEAKGLENDYSATVA
jgi:hypothetical protein